ncbi:hypothetical protein BT93_B3086 [Corymbia citriodora subsp. variegata]|nr:hypothetical protein BT93_B3086 [Corymbia citriodora subsp. variegata]
MAFLVYKKLVLLAFVLLLGNMAYASNARAKYDTALFNRSSFPSKFLFGTASSAYQYEGAAKVDGRGPSIWDTFTHKYPEKIADGSNGDVAIDQYHKYKEDVGIMKEMGLDAYRLSISWPRILPNFKFFATLMISEGTVEGGISKAGIAYYNRLIDELLAHGIKPFITIFHWDLPQPLEDEYGGFLSSKIVDHFQDFADVCFKEFGDRVKHWITVNEPWTFCDGGYVLGSLAPGRCSAWQQLNCTGGDSATEPYIVGHNLLLAHAAAVKLYRDKYQASQKGVIGITLISHWFVPYSDAKHNLNAVQRALDFMLGWFLDPIVYGSYPHSMQSLVGNRLPKFTKEQSLLLKGSYDFLGLNYYTAFYAAYAHYSVNAQNMSYVTDALTNLTRIDEFNNSTLPLEQQLADPMRIDYYYRHLQYLLKAIKDGVNVKGYFAWSLLDNFEWGSGYTVRFGINYVDYKNGLKRYPKHSAIWFKSFLSKH